jgi:hypothetical protein
MCGCCCVRSKKKEESPAIIPVMSKTQIITILLDRYIDIASFFNKHNIYNWKYNDKFTYLMFLERKLSAIKPDTADHKELLENFTYYKTKIDLLVYPKRVPKKREEKSNTLKPLRSKPPVMFEINNDVPKESKFINTNNDSGILIETEIIN